MILVEDLLRLGDVDLLFAGAGGFVPRQRGHPFEIGPRDHVLGRGRSHLREALEFAVALLLRFGGHPGLFDLLAQLFDFRLAVVGFAQFLLNRLHLLAQQEFALALVHLLLHLVVNLVAQLEHFLFFGKLVDQGFQALAHVECFEQLLPHHGVERRQSGSDEIGQPSRRIDVHRFGLEIVGKLRRTRHYFAEQFLDVALERRQFRIGLVFQVRLRSRRARAETASSPITSSTRMRSEAFQKRHHVTVGHAHHFVNLGERANAVKVRAGRQSRCADQAAPPRRAAFRDLPENQAARESFPGPPATALRRPETGPCLAREESRALLERLSFVWPR